MGMLGSAFTAFLQVVGILNWAKQVLNDHSVKQVQQAADVASDRAATLQEVAEIQRVKDASQNMSHQQLLDAYAGMRARIKANASNSGR